MAHAQQRPLSPHLQIWRWHVTMLCSIAHRASGIAMYVGVLGLAKWLVLAAIGGEWFALYNSILASPIGQVALYLIVAAFGYHLCNGIRYLFWDRGKGFEPKIANMMSWIILAVGVIGAPLGLYLLVNAG